MTIYSSQMISGMVGQQLGMFQGYGGYAQGIGVGAGLYPMGPGPRAVSPPAGLMGVRPGQAGMYGERVAMQMANAGMSMGATAASFGQGAASFAVPFDPLSGAVMGGMMGMIGGPVGMVGGAIGGAALGAGIGGAMYGAQRIAGAYTGAFTGGMQEQAGINATLRNNFSFFGGQGAFGRGFGQSQMGQIGSMISGELRRNPYSNMQEMNNLIAGGADAGLFTATRDVQSFTQNFRRMLDNLRNVQRELGGTLTDALQFVRSSQQAGIFQNADRVNFAAEIRSAEAVTGMDRNQLVALSAQGAGIARTYGARGSQGAFGVLRAAQTMGSAISSGSVSQELLSEATGGLTGADAIASFAASTMQRSGAFSRRAMGRYSLFAMSNASGTGLDEDMVERFRSGDLTVGSVSRAAHRRISGMGRARALNAEGRLRGELMEEGGMSAQIGMMRLMLGDRALDAGDDVSQLVLQRRFGMSQPQSELMLQLIRNQSRIAQSEAFDSAGAAREVSRGRDITENRSFEAFERALEHGLSDSTGLSRAREMGRGLMTRVSSYVERAMNDVMGVAESTLTTGDRSALNRLATGRATREDIARLSTGGVGAGPDGSLRTADLFRSSLAATALHALPFGLGHHAPEGMRMTLGERLEARGVEGLRGAGAEAQAFAAVTSIERARMGLVSGADRTALVGMEGRRGASSRAIMQAELIGERGSAEFYQALRRRGISANAADAYMAGRGVTDFGAEYNTSNVGGGGRTDADMWMRDAVRLGGSIAGTFARANEFGVGSLLTGGAGAQSLGGRLMGSVRQLGGLFGIGGHSGELETLAALRSPEERAAIQMSEYIGRGAARIERAGGRPGETDAEKRERVTLARSMRGVSEEALSQLAGNEDYRSFARGIAGASSRDEIRAQIEAFREIGLSNGSSDQRKAMEAMLTTMERELQDTGTLSDQTRGVLGGSVMSPQRRRELLIEQNRREAGYRGVAERLRAGTPSAGAERIAGFAKSAAEAAASGDGEAENAAAQAYISHLASLDPESAEYQQWSEAMAGDPSARVMRAAVSGERQYVRDMTGQGRGGRRRADRTALGQLTGGTMSDMTFEIGSGRSRRRVRGSDTSEVMRLLQSDQHGASIQRQLTEHLAGLGIEGAGGMVREFASLAQGGFTDAESLKMRQMTARVEDAARQRQQEETLAAAGRRDPLGAERNTILREIQRGIDRMAPPGEDRAPNNTGGAGGGGAGHP